jgi:D-alanine-D-alanine ligase
MPSPSSVLVLYNEPVLPRDHPDAESEYDVLETVADVVKALMAAGFAVRKLGINHDPQPLLDEVKQHRPDAVFNLFEGIPTRPGTEVSAAALLEWLGVPFTGCPSVCLALGRDKVWSKHMLAASGLPTPAYLVVDREPVPAWTGGWPAFVKPALEDASVGIDQGSVVTDQARLAARVRHVLDHHGPPVLIEEFVGGREFHVNVIEEGDANRTITVLPLAEIAYREGPPGWWPVYTYTAKWDLQSAEFRDSPLIAPVELPPEPTARLRDLATQTFRLFQCRDFARIDVRMSADGAFHVLEMNPNPYLISIALVKGLEAIGRSHEQFLVQMARAALRRQETGNSREGDRRQGTGDKTQ